MRIIDAEPGTKACDHFGIVSETAARGLRAGGFEAIGLYPEVCTAASLHACTSAGLGVWWILEGLAASTYPTATLGYGIARRAIELVREWGSPEGDSLFGDLEGTQGAPDTWAAFSDAQSKVILEARSVPGVYVGAGLGMLAHELYELRAVRYGRSGSDVPEPECGYCWEQGRPLDYAHAPSGLRIDVGALWHDYRGRAVTLVVAD